LETQNLHKSIQPLHKHVLAMEDNSTITKQKDNKNKF